MRPGTIGRRYARALFMLAAAQQTLESVGSALATITDALAEPDVMRVLAGPAARERKRDLLLKIVEATNAPKMVRDFLFLLADHDRLQQVPAIRTVFDGLLDDKHGITRATIRSAVALSPEILEEIARAFGVLTSRRVIAQVEIVPDLIAGVIVEVDGKVYDGSLRTQLDKLHQRMATAS